MNRAENQGDTLGYVSVWRLEGETDGNYENESEITVTSIRD